MPELSHPTDSSTPTASNPWAFSHGQAAPQKWHWLGWAAILLGAAAIRLIGITHTEVWRDEAITIIHSHDSWRDLLTRLPWVEDTPPLVFLLLKAWALISYQEWFLRLQPVLFGTAWVFVLMRTAVRIHPRAWWTTGLIAACAPAPVHFSQEIRVYALLLLLLAAAFWAIERAVAADRRGRWLMLAGVFAALAGNAHVIGILFSPMLVLYAVGRLGRSRLELRWAVSTLAVFAVLILPMVWFTYHWATVHAGESDWTVGTSPLKDVLQRMFGRHLLLEWSLRQQSAGKFWAAFAAERTLLAGGVLFLTLGLLNARTRRLVALLAAVAAGYVVILSTVNCFSPVLIDRTVLPVWTPTTLVLGVGAAAGMAGWQRLCGRVLLLAVVVIWSCSWMWSVQYGPPRRPECEPMFAWMRARLGPHDLIYTSPRWFKDLTVYRLSGQISADQLLDEYEAYAGRPSRRRMTYETGDGWQDRFARKLHATRQVAGNDFNIWVVSYAPNCLRPDDSPEAWLTRRIQRIDGFDFYADKPVSVTRYRPAASQPASASATAP